MHALCGDRVPFRSARNHAPRRPLSKRILRWKNRWRNPMRDPSTGGDSFTTLQWRAMPDEPAILDDYLKDLWMVPDIKPFAQAVDEIEFASGGYRIEVSDLQNEFLEEDDETGDEAVDGPE
jgi:hypothetical protein